MVVGMRVSELKGRGSAVEARSEEEPGDWVPEIKMGVKRLRRKSRTRTLA